MAAGLDFDVIVIGAGMSGLAAGVRLAYFDRRVCIVERHYRPGGLNSYYTLDGRKFDVGLHALTNYVPPGVRNAPLSKLLRQLRIPRDVLDLCQQSFSAVRFPGRELRFGNDLELLTAEVAREFPRDADNFCKLVADIRAFADPAAGRGMSARRVLADHLQDPSLIDMLLCPILYYGGSRQHDIDYSDLVILFRSIFLEGLCRPREGIRRIIAELVKRYRAAGGEFRMNCGVQRLKCSGDRVTSVILDDGQELSAGTVISSAGHHETMALCGANADTDEDAAGRLTFLESISILNTPPAELGLQATIVFFNDAESFTYAPPDDFIDPRSGVICCPNNYERHQDMTEGVLRLTCLADYRRWASLPPAVYRARKQECADRLADRATRFIPDFRDRVIYRDIFTPRTIRHFTGHLNGAVYGAARKHPDGRTHLQNLFLCGTDQGLLGVVGAILSGISMANEHVLME